MKYTFTLLGLVLFINFTSGQNFRLYPEMEITSLASNGGELTLANGDVVTGELSLATVQTSSGLQRITSVIVRNEGEDKQKFKPKDISELRINANWSDNSTNDAAIKFYAEAKSDYYIFRTVKDNKGKQRLMQLLNPGFDDNLQVYVDAKAKDSGFASMLGKDSAKSYYVTKDVNDKAMYLKKSKYKKTFKDVYGDCSTMMVELGDDKPNWNDFAQHVYSYNEECE